MSSEFDFTVSYKQGKCNTNADALSRIEINNEDTNSMIVNPSEQPASLADESRTLTVHTDAENPILEVPISDDSLNKFQKQLVLTVVGDIKGRSTVTKPFENYTRTSVQISKSNIEEDVVNAIKEFVNPKVKTGLLIIPSLEMYSIIPIIQNHFKSSAMNLVLTKTEIDNVKDYYKQQEVIRAYHEGKTNHRGINECYLSLSHKYYWPRMRESITKFINECTICGQSKYDRNPVNQKFNIVPPPAKPFEIVHLDLFSVENQKYLTIIDAFSKYAQAYFLRDATAVSVVQALLLFCTHHGIPMTIVTDRGPEFTNQLFSEFTRLHKINHHKILAYAPNENGMVERLHSTLLEHLRILKINHRTEPVTNLMPYAILAYNNSIHSFTKCRPINIITGHLDSRDPLDINLSENALQQYMQDHKNRMLQVYDILNETSLHKRTELIENANKDREPEAEFSPNQTVFIRNPTASRQKTAPRYTRDTVLADLPIHIYTKRKRGPVAKSRLKRLPNSTRLLQDTASSPEPGGS